MSEGVRYYHDDRTYLAQAKGTPTCRVVVKNSNGGNGVISAPRLGGLHHRHDRPHMSQLRSSLDKVRNRRRKRCVRRHVSTRSAMPSRFWKFDERSTSQSNISCATCSAFEDGFSCCPDAILAKHNRLRLRPSRS
jgi:hypothetical protein